MKPSIERSIGQSIAQSSLAAALAVAFVGWTLGGCQTVDSIGPPVQTHRAAPAAADAADRAVERQVHDAIVEAVGWPATDGLAIRVKRGVATLSGSARSWLAKQAALAAARSVGGVRSVVDGVEVAGRVRSDAAILADVREGLQRLPPAEAGALTATVDDGVVTLRGTVRRPAEAQAAVRVAGGVEGVFEVRDETRRATTDRRAEPARSG